MKTAPHDGTIVDLRHVSRQWGECIFRARWLPTLKIWIDWDRQHVALDKSPLKGWRVSDLQLRQWTDDEIATLTEIHDPKPGIRYLDPYLLEVGIRQEVPPPH